jgi:pectate lyase
MPVLLLLLLLLLLVPTTSRAQQLAFPTAEGFGRFASGGRGGRVCQVTNLNDSGPGSLRDCLGQRGARTVVFTVSGIINLTTGCGLGNTGCINSIPDNVTLACQTSPGGVLIKGRIFFGQAGTHNVIMRHCRFRDGDPPAGTHNNLFNVGNFTSTSYAIVDHCSFGWSSDDMAGLDQLTGTQANFTVQWSLFSESITDTAGSGGRGGGSNGALILQLKSNARASIHHNLFANVRKRTPHPQGGDVQVVNNVVHNVQSFEGIYLLAKYSRLRATVVGNFLQALPGAPNTSLLLTVGCGHPSYRCTPAFEAGSLTYYEGNVHTLHRPRAAAGADTALLRESGARLPHATALLADLPPLPSQTDALTARDAILLRAGAIVPRRDSADQRAVDDVRTNTGRRCGVSTPNSTCPVFPTYPAVAPPPDRDRDGIPDAWEVAHGLDPNSAADGPVIGPTGYSNLELYLNELAGDTGAPPPGDSRPTPRDLRIPGAR